MAIVADLICGDGKKTWKITLSEDSEVSLPDF